MDSQDKPVVQLSGEDGNAFAIIGACKKAAKKAGWSAGKIKGLMDKMTEGDYDNLLVVAQEYFNVQ